MTDQPPPPDLGLALSGGGFRAAFFHVGVLADLAERGVLRHVGVISTVSGGSIVGALYYLHVRSLLRTKPDAEVADDDYVKIVQRVAEDLHDGVATNIRGRTFQNLWDNIKMGLLARYSRSDRLGELYDSTFYRPAWDTPAFGESDELLGDMVQMRDLVVHPPGQPDFNPVRDNHKRSAKVPILVINATSLNTGHNWRFEATSMGEPDRAPVDTPPDASPREDARREVDRNDRLRWEYYANLADNQANFELGLAVAASACVPTLFHPLPVTRLFQRPDGDAITVQLVDGGLHDNQGIEGLIEYRCGRMIVSDASGYLPDEDKPSTRIPAVAGRSMGVYGDRVREEQLINARLGSGQRPFALVHLRKGITGYAVSPKGPGGDPIAPPRPEPPADFAGETFEIHAEVQDLLSKMRTDLDAFSEVEAYTLMLDGYLMAGANVDGPVLDGLSTPRAEQDWDFKVPALVAAANVDTNEPLLRHLKRAKSRFLKPVLLDFWAAALAVLLLALLVAGLVALAWIDAVRDVFTAQVDVWQVALAVLVVLGLVGLYVARNLWRPLRWLAEFAYAHAMPTLLALPLWVGSFVVLGFSRIFVRIGRVSKVIGG